MPLADKYVCYSVERGMKQGVSVKTLTVIGVGCKMTGEQMLKVVAFLAKRTHIKPPKTYIKNVNTGHGGSQYIIIPHWVLHQSKPQILAYIAHEFAHYLQMAKRVKCRTVDGGHYYESVYVLDGAHGKTFKRIERRMLRYFGLGIKYKHAYAKSLTAIKTGKVLWYDPRTRALDMMREERIRQAEARRVESTPAFVSMRADLTGGV